MDEEEVYEIWIGRIINRFEKGEWNGEKGLREHIIHHSLELENRESIPLEWMTSMTTLVDMAKRLSGYDVDITVNKFKEEDCNIDTWRSRIINHAINLRNNNISFEWIMTMIGLLSIVKTLARHKVTKRLQIERLYLHWRDDMAHMEPPPFEVVLLERKVEYVSSGSSWRPGDS